VDQDHPRAGSGHLVVAALTGAAQRHANWHQLTEGRDHRRVVELQKILADRDDGPELLAEAAGILLGFSEGSLDEAKAKAAAQLGRLAGADEALIPRWAEEGRRRAASARPAIVLRRTALIASCYLVGQRIIGRWQGACAQPPDLPMLHGMACSMCPGACPRV
jgi:hypothetical protein